MCSAESLQPVIVPRSSTKTMASLQVRRIVSSRAASEASVSSPSPWRGSGRMKASSVPLLTTTRGHPSDNPIRPKANGFLIDGVAGLGVRIPAPQDTSRPPFSAHLLLRVSAHLESTGGTNEEKDHTPARSPRCCGDSYAGGWCEGQWARWRPCLYLHAGPGRPVVRSALRKGAASAAPLPSTESS